MQLEINFTGRFFNYRFLYFSALLVLIPAIVFAGFYIFSTYSFLADWWTGLSPCFYEREIWRQNFFTPEIKYQGNILSAFAFAFSLIGIVYIFYRIRNRNLPETRFSITLKSIDIVLILLLLATGLGLWIWGWSLVPLVGDEVRSALDSAGLHPFQTLSYYMLPNNHILFNFLNNVLFFWADDKVITGKFNSLAAYFTFGIITYLWFRKITKSRFFAFFSALILSLQFPVWAFSFQGRGYEWYNVCGWLAFISFLEYLRNKNKNWLAINTLACIIGYALVPTFLYFHVALVLFGIFYQVFHRRFDFEFWKYQAILVFFVFLFYLPAFSFSGISAFSESRYIKPLEVDLIGFLKLFSPITYMEYVFSWFVIDPSNVGYFLFFSPLLLLFWRKEPRVFHFLMIYVFLILAVTLVFIAMRRFTFHRALIIQCSIVLSLVVYLLFRICEFLNEKIKIRHFGKAVFLILFLVSTYHFVSKNTRYVHYLTYFSDMKYFENYVREGIKFFPDGSSVAFSSESYNWRYLAKDKDLQINHCISGNEDYIVKQDGESYPPINNYRLVKKVEDYNIYERVK